MAKGIGYLIKNIHVTHTWKINQMLEQYDLTTAQLNVLIPVFIAEKKQEEINQRDIENHLKISNPTVTGILNRLESKGLIERTASRQDHRIRYIHPTSKAKAIDQKTRKIFDDYERVMLKGFSQEEEILLKDMLTRVLNNIKDKEEFYD